MAGRALDKRSTAAALDQLPSTTWTVLHDVPWPGHRHADVDHVAIGPSGVFVVHFADWSGDLSHDEGTLRVTGRRRARAIASADQAAVAVARLMPNLPMHLVRPVVCLVRDEPVSGQAGRVLICSTETVVDLLAARSPELSTEQLRLVRSQLPDLLHNSRAVRAASKDAHASRRRTTRARRSTPKAQRPDRRHARKVLARRSRNGSLVPVLLIIAVAIAFIGFPHQLEAAGQALTHTMTQLATSDS